MFLLYLALLVLQADILLLYAIPVRSDHGDLALLLLCLLPKILYSLTLCFILSTKLHGQCYTYIPRVAVLEVRSQKLAVTQVVLERRRRARHSLLLAAATQLPDQWPVSPTNHRENSHRCHLPSLPTSQRHSPCRQSKVVSVRGFLHVVVMATLRVRVPMR